MSKVYKIGTFLLFLAIACYGVYLFLKPKALEIKVHLHPVPFSSLPGWGTDDLTPSFEAFKVSCKVFLNTRPNKRVGSELINLRAKDWQPACKAAMEMPKSIDSNQIRNFFQTWFGVVEFHNSLPEGQSMQGMFTGYYVSTLNGSLTKTKRYNIPIYGIPNDLITVNLGLFSKELKNQVIVGRVDPNNRLVPYYTRAEIDNGVIEKKAPVIAWVDNYIDRLFLEIQGSGAIVLPDGNSLYINYVAQNGAAYSSIASVLINKGLMTKHNASMQHIREFFAKNPDQIKPIMSSNKSFVFFDKLKKNTALGAQGTELTAGYSLAVDRKWVPIGAPIWLNTTRPVLKSSKTLPFQRLMIAQDTGGAIRGVVRGDVFWGSGKKAFSIAGRMKNQGQYWMLLPKHVVDRIVNS